MPGRINHDLAKRIHFLDGNGEFFPQHVHQTGHAGAPPGHHDFLNALAGRGGAKKVKCLLNFEHQNVGYGPQNSSAVFLGDARDVLALFQSLRVFVAQVQLFLQRVRVLVASDGDVSCEQRDSAAHDVDIHHACPDVQQRNRLARVWIVVHLIAVLQRKGIDVHDRRILPGLSQNVRMIQDLIFLHRHEQNVQLRIHRLKELVVKIHVGNVERDVLAGFGLDAVVQLFLAHHRKGDPLDDDGVARDCGRYILSLDFLRLENVADRARDQRRIHDRAIHDGVLRQGLQAKTHQLIALFSALQLDRLNGTRADVQPHECFLFSATKHIEAPSGVPASCHLPKREPAQSKR